MDKSDAHLERALAEYNEKVNELESEGDSEQLLEAYVNRASVLAMMDYVVSAIEDLESADEIIRSMEADGQEVDDGTFVKTYTSLAELLFEQEEGHVEMYARAAERVIRMNPDSRHFDFRSTVRMCITSIENLVDSSEPDAAEPFMEKAMSMVMTKNSSWEMNRKLQLLNLEAEMAESREDMDACVDSYARAIDVGTELLEREQLEDMEELVMSFVSKADAEDDMGLTDMYIADTKASVTLLEHMLAYNRLDDTELLVALMHSLASTLMKQGKIDEAEQYLMKAMRLDVQGAGDYIRSQTDRDI